MEEPGRHGPLHPSHLHSAFEDPEAQASSSVSQSDQGAAPSEGGGGTAAQPPPSAVPPPRPHHHHHHHRRHQEHRNQRRHSQPLVAAAASSSPSRPPTGIHVTASSPPARAPPRAASASPPHSLSVSPSPSPSGSPASSRSASPISRPRSRASPGSARGLPSHHLYGALDGAALAAACAAAPLNPAYTLNVATSHRSFAAPSTHRGGGLRRGEEASGGVMNNIHPDILDDLRALDDLEGGSLLRPLLTQPPAQGDDDGGGGREGGGGGEGGGGEGGEEGEGRGGGGEGDGGGGHVDEAETYEVQELLEAKPRDVLQFIEEEGVVKLVEFEVADGLVLKAFGSEPFLAMGDEHAEPPGLRDIWMERLSEGGKVQGTGWTSTLTVEAHVVNLYDAAAPGHAGLLRPLLARLRVHGCPPTVFALPAVQAVISHKWNTWARHFLMAEFVFYAAWLAAFSAFSLLLEDGADTPDNDEEAAAAAAAAPPFQFAPAAAAASGGGGAGLPVMRLLSSVVQAATAALRAGGGGEAAAAAAAFGGGGGIYEEEEGCPAERLWNPWDWRALWGLLGSPRGFAQLVTSTAAVAAMLPFAYMELCTVVVQGLAWLNLFNLADVASYGLAVAIWFVHLRCGSLPASAAFSGALALQHVLLWSKLHYYARVLTPTRGGFNDTIRMVLSELRTFLTFVGLVMMGFAFAFYCLFRQDRDNFADFSTLWHSFASMFAYMLQMFDYSVLYNSTHPILAMVLFMAYELMVAVLLLNIMIALMTAAFARVSADEGLRYLIYKAEVIDELESTLPRWLMRPAWFPHFVHVLKISPRSTYEINLNSVWSGMSTLQSSLMNAQQETRLRVEALESKMDIIDQKLSATVRLLASRLLTHSELAAALSMDDVAEASDGSNVDAELDLDRDLYGEDGEPDPEKWRDADLDPRPDEQAVPEAPEDLCDDEGVAALLRVRRGGGGGGSRRGGGSHRGVGGVGGQRERVSLPSPRRLHHSQTYGVGYQYGSHGHHHHYHHQPSGGHHHHHHSASHAASAQLPLRNQSHGHGHHRGSQGPSAATSHGPSRDPSIPTVAGGGGGGGHHHSHHPHHARTMAAPQAPRAGGGGGAAAAASGARLHAFYSHGHGHGYQQQQQQQRHRGSESPPQEPPVNMGRASYGSSGGAGAGGRPGTAPAIYGSRYEVAAGDRPSGSGDGDGGGGVAAGFEISDVIPEGAVVLDMRQSEDRTDRTPPFSPSRAAAAAWGGALPPPQQQQQRDDGNSGYGSRPYNYHRWYSTGSSGGGYRPSWQGQPAGPTAADGESAGDGGDGPGGGGGSGGGGGPVMASIAEHGSPSLAGSETLTDTSPQRRSEAGGTGARDVRV
ncbi:hypothetical protein PLESTB_000737500 [Pleodorina starrii]|uniref:Polycystin cation channel PKD1/PKD2 domain-containing protein n=1 Tax=Pleodorina starrii TaxID=330485 RepID=A0A9W6F2H6_9CHLO|nr:hypothetical protein PLESTM_000186800 [Pleodorina starrii]GLC53370.1 hypothetical protein PLESTB_000737500 [Pleodorina starrii]GLC67160.1 hypothetical protein PLESTF_000523600 [Pleodorina starrii]